MRLQQLFAVRFVHSEEETKTPLHQVIIPNSLAVNAGDGSIFTTEEDGTTVRLTGAQDLHLENYVGHDRPLAGLPTGNSEFNNGVLDGLTDVLNHVYFHTRAFIPSDDEGLIGGVTITENTPVRLIPQGEPKVGENRVIIEYQSDSGLEQIQLYYTIPEGMTTISPLRLRFRDVRGEGNFSTIGDALDAEVIPYNFIPKNTGLWVIELVHDYNTSVTAYEGGDLVGYIRIGVQAADEVGGPV